MRFFIAMLAGVLALMAGVVTGLAWLMGVGAVVFVLAVVLWIAAPALAPRVSEGNEGVGIWSTSVGALLLGAGADATGASGDMFGHAALHHHAGPCQDGGHG